VVKRLSGIVGRYYAARRTKGPDRFGTAWVGATKRSTSIRGAREAAPRSAQRAVKRRSAAARKPIAPEDKRRLADLHAKVIGSRVIKDVLKAQADYLELMTAVSQRIEEAALGLADES
jgi:hypothetical protein